MMKVRKGFTLVELLIVIVIIGILAAAMLLSSGSATASAEASNVVSELRNMKAAALMFYSDSMDAVNAAANNAAAGLATAPSTAAKSALAKYMDNPEKFNVASQPYRFTITGVTGQGTKWFVGYDVAGKTNQVKEKLAGKAKSVGLLAGTADLTTVYTTGTSVWMVAR